MNNGVISESV